MADRAQKTPDRKLSRPANSSASKQSPAQAPSAFNLAPALQTPTDVLALQRSLGNAATHRLIQAKLTVGAAHDPLEQEADRVADQVVNRSSIQRNPEEDELQAKRVDPSSGSGLRISRAPAEEDELMTKRDGMLGSFEAGSDFEQKLGSSGGGKPLDTQTRSHMEAGIGADFSSVRVHTGSQASSLNRSISAKAFTRGSDVFFDSGQYNPGSVSGKRLIAHELTHVVQQGSAAQGASAQRKLVQRYPATVAQSEVGVDWESQTASVKKSGEGVSGGVFFFTSNEGAKRKVVVKPEYIIQDDDDMSQSSELDQRRTGANAIISDEFLSHAGASVPAGRLLNDNSAEGEEIQSVAAQKGAAIPPTRQEGNAFTYYLRWIRVMDVAGGDQGGAQSMSSLAEGARSDDGMSRLLSRLNDARLMKKIGKLMAFDAFMQNTDRVDMNMQGTFANLGNIMLSNNDVYAIDSNAIFAATSTDLMSMDNIFSKRDAFVSGFLEIIKVQIPDEINKGVYDSIYKMYGSKWQQNLSQGIDEGFAQLRVQLGKKKRAGLKGVFQQTNALFGGQKEDESPQYNIRQNWERVRERQKYMKLRMAGQDDKDANQGVSEYQRYRQARAQTPKGLKWTTKLKYKFGSFSG